MIEADVVTVRHVEILCFASCPGRQDTIDMVRAILHETPGLVASLSILMIETEEEARAHRFHGSPTVRVNGRDVDHAADESEGYSLRCRLYAHEGRLVRVPPSDWIRAALRGAPT